MEAGLDEADPVGALLLWVARRRMSFQHVVGL